MEGYIVQEAPPRNSEELQDVIPPPRQLHKSVPGLSWNTYFEAKQEMLTRFGLEEYADCVMKEADKRPIPFVQKVDATKALTDLYEKRIEAIFEYFIPKCKYPIQALNRESSLGAPYYQRPESKRAVVLPFFERTKTSSIADLAEGMCTPLNVRLQPEDAGKERLNAYISDDGRVYQETINQEKRTITDFGRKMVLPRTRYIFRGFVLNLIAQPADTMLHNAYLQCPALHHDMSRKVLYVKPGQEVRAIDIKSMERFTGPLAMHRARVLGGMYREIYEANDAMPFIVPSDSWKSAWYVWPDRKNGYCSQFPSGMSAVTTSQKEAFMVIIPEFAENHLRIPANASLQWYLNGGDDRLQCLNYGDDNLFVGEPSLLDDLMAHIRQYLEAQIEDPPRFLGYDYVDGKFELSVKSYLLKTYLNERGPHTVFRPYPFFGWIEKRKTYIAQGNKRLATEVFPYEEMLLGKLGHPWSYVQIEAAKEAAILGSRASSMRVPAWLLGKDYLMTQEQRIATGLFEGLYPAETKPMIDALLGDRWRKLLV